MFPGPRKSPGEVIGYPFQCSWASLVAPSVKNQPPIVGDLGSIPGLGRSSEGGHGNSVQNSCWRIPMERGVWWAPWGHKELDTTEQLSIVYGPHILRKFQINVFAYT